MKINDLSYNATGARYGYNGTHEQDLEVNANGNYLDFGNFGYDTRVAMRRNQEPLSFIFPRLSSYSTMNSNPINFKDDNGNLFVFASGFEMIDRGGRRLTFGNFSNFLDLGKSYWKDIDDQFMDKHNDFVALYISASSPRTSTARDREKEIGNYAGRELLSKLKSGAIKLLDDEMITFVSHSQGTAVNAAILRVLMADKWFMEKYGDRIGTFYALAPKQPNQIQMPQGNYRIVQYSSNTDNIASQPPLRINPGQTLETWWMPESDKDWATNGHRIFSYDVIFGIPIGKNGHVAPCKDCDTPLAPHIGGK